MRNVVCPMSTLGERIKLARAGISQDAFSRELNISKGSLGFYERNENLPNTEVVLKICSKTGVGLEWLLTGKGPMRPADTGDSAEENAPEAQTAEYGASPSCERCARMEKRLDRLEEERRELSEENRRLWKENAELRERCARLEEREKQEGVLPFLERAALSGKRKNNA